MAALLRRTWADLKAEAIRRLGGRTEASFAARVEHWLDAAQLDLGLLFHHYELNRTDTALVLVTGQSTVTLPLDCYIVLGVALREPGGQPLFKRWLTLQHLRYVQANFSETRAVPTEYARFGRDLQLNCNSDAAYPLLLRYYKVPAAPDFAVGSPELARLWDEHLLEAAVAKGQGSVWRPDLAGVTGETLQAFLASQVQPALLAEVLPDRSTVPTTNRTHGGGQG